MNLSQDRELARFFSYVAPKYEAHTHCLTIFSDNRWRRFTVNCLFLRPGDKLLDLSTGTGQLARLASRHPARPLVSALDSNPEMLALARQKTRGHNINYIQADARSTPFPDNTFQAVTMGFGLRIMPDRPALLREILRILRPGGRVYFLETSALNGWRRKLLISLRPLIIKMVEHFDRQLLSYCYLLDSMLEFPEADGLRRLLSGQGFIAPRSYSLSPPLAHLHIAEKPPYPMNGKILDGK